MNPLGQRDFTKFPPVSSNSSNWIENLPLTLKTPSTHRSRAFSALINKFFQNPQRTPQAVELNAFFVECMFHGETTVLIDVLPQIELLDINFKSANGNLSIALNTLLDALTITLGRNPISKFCLVQQQFRGKDEIHMLFEILSRMPALQSVDIHSCAFDLTPDLGPCARLPLKSLYFGHMKDALPVLEKILLASQLTELHLISLDGSPEQHVSIAEALTKQTTIATLGFKSCKTIEPYFAFLAKQSTIQNLCLYNIPLLDEDCSQLHIALQDKSTLTHLSLRGCWPSLGRGLNSEAPGLAQLLSLESLCDLDLARNFLFAPAAPVLLSLAAHPKLQTLDLDQCNMDDQCIHALASVFEKNEILTCVTLPYLRDECYKPLVGAIQANNTLQSLSNPHLDKLAEMLQAHFPAKHPNYAALVTQVSANFRKRMERDHEDKAALIGGNMRALLAGLRGVGSGAVPSDVAAYAAQFAIRMNGEEAMLMTLPLLNKSAHEEGLKARDRIQRGRPPHEKPDDNMH
ncbi:hypothetical protein GCM10023165_43570 [Variovorax defluvii]|uniref:Leucine rich repeat (LRR) protein n=1 Tax=Variovorax defluvii TaxID=913761 RepID=A0ABP8I838_9BURK